MYSAYVTNVTSTPLYSQALLGNPAYTGLKSQSDYCKLKVSGKGSILAPPDMAVAVLGVITENIQLEAAQKENAEKTASVINSLIRQGIPREDIQTQTYNIQPMYDYIDGKQIFRGYKVTHNLKVNIKNIGSVGEIVDSATKAGANSVSGIEFSVSNPSIYYKNALNEAINDALSKAETVGRKLRVYVYPVPVQIVEETYQQNIPAPYTLQTTAQTTPIQPGQIEITALIEAIFIYSCSNLPG